MTKILLDKDGERYIYNNIYKYATINENFYSLLINNEIWFSDPTDFNDPYDCNLKYNLSGINYSKVYNYLLKANAKENHGMSIEFLEKRANDICSKPEELRNVLGNLLSTSMESRGISCFSQSDSKLLMWSHYSNSHKGVCLTFDIENDLEVLNIPIKLIIQIHIQ